MQSLKSCFCKLHDSVVKEPNVTPKGKMHLLTSICNVTAATSDTLQGARLEGDIVARENGL